MSKFVSKKTDDIFSKTTKKMKGEIDTFATKLNDKLESSEGAKKLLVMAGELCEGATKAGTKLVDNLSGAEALALVEELLAKQRRYNDILATRLAEALERIEHLEQRIESLTDAR